MAFNSQNEHLNQKITHLEARVDQLQNESKAKDGQIVCLNDTIVTLKNQLQKQAGTRVGLQKILQAKKKQLFEAGGQNLAKDNLLEQRQAEIQKYKNQIMQLRHQLKNNKAHYSTGNDSESGNNETQTEKFKSVKLSEMQVNELDRLEKENKQLFNDNLKLQNELEEVSSDEFLTKAQIKTIKPSEIKLLSKESHQLIQKTPQLAKNQELPQTKQEWQEQQAPKKRKLMRKPRIQVDIDTFAVTPVNI